MIDESFGTLDIGLPVQQVEPVLRQAIHDGAASETTLDALDRRGRKMKCRVRILLYDDRKAQGAVIVVDDISAAPKG